MVDILSVFREYGRLERMREEQGLSALELERWTTLKRVLASHFRPGIGDEFTEKRSSLRLPSQLQVSFDSYGQLRKCLMTNISRGGVFIVTPDPLPVGTPLNLRIEIAQSGRTHELSGEVASLNPGADMKTEDRGMGIRFCSLDEEQEELVRQLYGRALDEVMKSIS